MNNINLVYFILLLFPFYSHQWSILLKTSIVIYIFTKALNILYTQTDTYWSCWFCGYGKLISFHITRNKNFLFFGFNFFNSYFLTSKWSKEMRNMCVCVCVSSFRWKWVKIWFFNFSISIFLVFFFNFSYFTDNNLFSLYNGRWRRENGAKRNKKKKKVRKLLIFVPFSIIFWWFVNVTAELWVWALKGEKKERK